MKTTRRRSKRERSRSARAVLRDHLQRRKRNDLEGDLKRNYSDDVVVITKDADRSCISGRAQSGRLCSRAKMLPLSTGGRKVILGCRSEASHKIIRYVNKAAGALQVYQKNHSLR
jgi:hypothetical protein